jgi:hypothetical protein
MRIFAIKENTIVTQRGTENAYPSGVHTYV